MCGILNYFLFTALNNKPVPQVTVLQRSDIYRASYKALSAEIIRVQKVAKHKAYTTEILGPI